MSLGPTRSEGEADWSQGWGRSGGRGVRPGPILLGCSCLPLGKKLFLGMPARSFPQQGSTYVHQCCVEVVAGFSIHRDEEGQAAVQRQDVHAPILIMVPGQQSDAAVLGPDARSHDVEGLRGAKQIGRHGLDSLP